MPARQIYDIVIAPDETLWIGSLDGGLIEGRQTDDGEYTFKASLANVKVHELCFDTKGRLWLATEMGIFVKDGESTLPVYPKCKVVAICCDSDGVIWAGSNGRGLIRIDGDDLRELTIADGLTNNCVESLVCDAHGNIVAGTDQGVSIVNRHDGSIQKLYSHRGLIADTYNENAILKTLDGRILMGSLRGLVELNTSAAQMSAVQQSAAPRVTTVNVNNVTRYDSQFRQLSLSHDQNSICFFFSSFAYQNQSSVVYSHKLEGIDTEWSPASGESKVQYTNLRPGHYRFCVRSRVSGGAWSEPAVCDVRIAQPWYWTWWARALYLFFILLLLLYELHQYRQRQSLRRQLDQRLAALYALEAQQNVSHRQKPDSDEEQTDSTPQTTDLPSDKTAKLPNNQMENEFLSKLDRLILENMLQSDLDVNFIAQQMCVSYSTLHRRIKSLTGMTVNEYVRKHRLVKAMQLLHEGHNATEVAMRCGFRSPSYFTRCFKAEYGILPSEV